ncbi:lysylphosphatidylglycerol synthase domain-containing protein [Limibacter armeniacum]|uniref:lysylphosphatidylglycerol synthase domain-containing protein n=1 Tax=Limibacter armeniacum TaxID=466084 RepID=UPI002FE65577
MQTKSIQSYGFSAIKLLILLTACIFIIQHLTDKQHLDMHFADAFQKAFLTNHALLLLVAILLMPLNWASEALKWQILASKIATINFKDALFGVLTGLSVSFFSGKIIGYFLGRSWHLPSKDKYQSFGATLNGHLSLGFVTGAFGSLCLLKFLLRQHYISPDYSTVLYTFWGVTISIGTVLLCSLHKFKPLLDQNKYFKKYLQTAITFSTGENIKILGLSTLRFMLFTIQFVLILYAFGGTLSMIDSLIGVGLVYISKTLTPSFSFLSDLGIREFTALYFFGAMGVDESTIISSTLFLWLLNILLPTLAGLFSSWYIKL